MKNNKNNGFVRNPFLYLLIIVAAVTGFQYFFAGNSIGQSQQIKLFLDLLGGNTQGLEKQFNLALSGTEKQWTLNLTPKTAVTRQIFNHIVISGDSVVRKIELDEKQGDKTVMQFREVQTGKPLDDFAKKAL